MNELEMAWSLLCAASLLGLWPRYIEPKLLFTTRCRLAIPNLPKGLHGLKIVQISDLHFNPNVSDTFLDRILAKIAALDPDILAFTGDILCRSCLHQKERLLSWLRRCHARHGCYAVLGNHDYAHYVSIDEKGEYDRLKPGLSSKRRILERLTPRARKLAGIVTPRASAVPLHAELIDLFKSSPFQLLDNSSLCIAIKGSKINIVGLGEYMLGRLDKDLAFKNYDASYPGIILLHNPDGLRFIADCPGEIVLLGHTHGGQINIPLLWKRFTLLEDCSYKRGLHRVGSKWAYINRGLGSILPFRCFSPPEIALFTLNEK